MGLPKTVQNPRGSAAQVTPPLEPCPGGTPLRDTSAPKLEPLLTVPTWSPGATRSNQEQGPQTEGGGEVRRASF